MGRGAGERVVLIRGGVQSHSPARAWARRCIWGCDRSCFCFCFCICACISSCNCACSCSASYATAAPVAASTAVPAALGLLQLQLLQLRRRHHQWRGRLRLRNGSGWRVSGDHCGGRAASECDGRAGNEGRPGDWMRPARPSRPMGASGLSLGSLSSVDALSPCPPLLHLMTTPNFTSYICVLNTFFVLYCQYLLRFLLNCHNL